MNEKDVAVNSLKAWILAARPKTLTSAAVPVLLGIALARGCMYEIKVLPAVLCMLFAFLMQIDANLVNDYFDFMRGNDDETRLGPKRAKVVMPMPVRMALQVTQPCAQARFGPRRVSSSLPRIKSK